MYRGLIACDNDGTLLPFGQSQLEARVKQLIWDLIDQGYLFCVASGRPYDGLIDLYREFMDEIIFICSNGAMIYHKHRLIQGPQHMERAVAQAVVSDLVKEQTASFALTTTEATYSLEGYSELIQKLYEADGFQIELAKSIDDIKGEILQICILEQNQKNSLAIRLQKKWDGILNVFPAGYDMIDITPCNKGSALLKVASQFGIPREQTYAIGDSHNDMPMLKVAGQGFLMDNADERLKAVIHRHCKDVTDVFEMLLASC